MKAAMSFTGGGEETSGLMRREMERGQVEKLPFKPVNCQPTSALPEVQKGAVGGTLFSDTSRPTKKKLKTATAMIRRSTRIQTIVGNQELKPIIKEIIISESQNDVEPMVHEINMSIKVASDETRRFSKKDDPCVTEIKYKTMYISSLKKIEALVEENEQLSKALDLANGAINVHEKKNNIYSEVMSVIGSLCRANENLAARLNLAAPIDDEEFEEKNSPG
ncbi:hypothetical protein SOVF_160590 isoform C [Spinacia oleracea]|nr:hypothetical protein SOVF_160590 isoform C [Spinacia oleracea]